MNDFDAFTGLFALFNGGAIVNQVDKTLSEHYASDECIEATPSERGAASARVKEMQRNGYKLISSGYTEATNYRWILRKR